MTTTLQVPDIGDFADVAIIEILVKVGDQIASEQSLITVESDKASMEIPASAGGVVTAILVKLGDKVSTGSPLIEIDAATANGAVDKKEAAPAASPTNTVAPVRDSAPAPSSAAAPAAVAATNVASVSLTQHDAKGLPYASPSVRKFARELGVDLSQVKGSADKGRITHEDVQSFVKTALSAGLPSAGTVSNAGNGLNLLPWPSLNFAAYGETRTEPLSRIKKISGQNLARNWAMIPHVTQFDHADITTLEEFRKAENSANPEHKLTILAFVIKASVAALKQFTLFNTSLDEANGQLIYKQYFNIGFAADTPNGLMVPVVKEADKKGVLEIAQELGRLSKLAREGKLGPKEMQGACFTVSSLGGIGGSAFTPIINAPEVAILGLSKSSLQPYWDGKAFVPRLMLPLSLSYDHRVIDGAQAARFTAYLSVLLSDVRKLIL